MIDKQWGDVNQLAGVILVSMGIAIEFMLHAHMGFVLITVGSLAFAIGTKIKH